MGCVFDGDDGFHRRLADRVAEAQVDLISGRGVDLIIDVEKLVVVPGASTVMNKKSMTTP